MSEFYVLKRRHIKFRCWGITWKKGSTFRTWREMDVKNKCALVNYFHCVTERLSSLNYHRPSHGFSCRKHIAVNHLMQRLVQTSWFRVFRRLSLEKVLYTFHLMPQNNWSGSFHFFISQIVEDLMLCLAITFLQPLPHWRNLNISSLWVNVTVTCFLLPAVPWLTFRHRASSI